MRDIKVVARKFKTIQAFLSHVERAKSYTTCDDGIQLMTIHRSKGLEFPIVYIIGAVDGLLPHDYALEAYRNGDVAPLEEERRLLYVAMTRAKERLFISVPSMRRLKKQTPPDCFLLSKQKRKPRIRLFAFSLFLFNMFAIVLKSICFPLLTIDCTILSSNSFGTLRFAICATRLTMPRTVFRL